MEQKKAAGGVAEKEEEEEAQKEVAREADIVHRSESERASMRVRVRLTCRVRS